MVEEISRSISKQLFWPSNLRGKNWKFIPLNGNWGWKYCPRTRLIFGKRKGGHGVFEKSNVHERRNAEKLIQLNMTQASVKLQNHFNFDDGDMAGQQHLGRTLGKTFLIQDIGNSTMLNL